MKKLFGILGIFFLNIVLSLAQNTETQYLSGTGSDNTVEWEFFCTDGMKSGKWATIPVPSNWELQGFGAFNYGYDKTEGRAKEKGLYKYKFKVKPEWENKTVNIVFEGSMTDTEVKINGISAGVMHQGAFYRFKYDISELLNFEGENLLEVTVSKVSSNESVNKAERNADYWIFGGIYRPVYLEALPESNIEKVYIDAAANGKLSSILYLSEEHKANNILAQLTSIDGEKIGTPVLLKIKNTDRVSLETVYKGIKKWTPETPNLYYINFQLLKNSKVLHSISKRIGFRTVELRERDGIYLNDVKIKFKGVNRHSFYPSTGRTLSKFRSIEDVSLVKDMNMNAIRNAHYPADIHFYEVCDSLGIMVLDELGGWHDAYDTEVGTTLVSEMLDKSINHPCVVMWVNGNEGGHNHDLLPLYDTLDIQKRPVVHAWETFRHTNTQHYRDYNYGNGIALQGHDIVFPTEFLHGMYDGGHGAGLEDFWKLMWNTPLSAGGFLWDFADEAVVRTDKNNILDSDGNHGADGILGPYHEKEGSYFTIKEVWSPIFIEHREITPEFDGSLRIENRFHFTNTSECSFGWELKRMIEPYTKLTYKEARGKAEAPNIIPGSKDTLWIDLPENFTDFDFLYITATDPFGKNIFTWSYPISLPEKICDHLVQEEGNDKTNVLETDSILSVQVKDMKVQFSKKTGLLIDVLNNKGKISFGNGPILCEGQGLFKELKYYTEDSNLIIESIFDESSFNKVVKWTIFPSGWCKLHVEYCPVEERHEMLGISFSYPEEKILAVKWMGDGPYRVWKNRMKGTELGVWKKKYNNTITGQTEYKYPEFKGYHSRMYWVKILNEEQPFTIVCPNEDIFFRMYTPPTPDDPYNTAPAFPEGDISFMHGITSMGTKCLQTYRMGPMSEKNIFYTYGGVRCKKIDLYFDFRTEH